MDLAALYGELAGDLPTDEEADDRWLTAGDIPTPPARLTTSSIRMVATHHSIHPGATFDLVTLSADQPTFRQLGTLCLGVLLHPDVSAVDLETTASDSELKVLRIELWRDNRYGAVERSGGLFSQPVAVRYGFSKLDPSSWGGWWNTPSAADKPEIGLLDAAGVSVGTSAVRDRVSGFGNDQALASMATLFLDFGAQSERDCYYLFGEDLTTHSAELAIGLPGTDWWCI
jgi:hypothetical protein